MNAYKNRLLQLGSQEVITLLNYCCLYDTKYSERMQRNASHTTWEAGNPSLSCRF